MRTFLGALIAVGVLSTPALADKGADKDCMKRLANAYVLMSKTQYKPALTELVWCFDHGSKDGWLRGHIIQAMGALAANYPPAGLELKVRRDAASRVIGDPPKVGPDVFTFLAINQVLRDTARNDRLISRIESAGVVRTFSTRPTDPTPPEFATREVADMVWSSYHYQRTLEKVEAVEYLRAEFETYSQQFVMLQEEEASILDEISELESQLETARDIQVQHQIIERIKWYQQRLGTHVFPKKMSIEEAKKYIEQLMGHRERNA
jgi:hypothetical protein